MVAAGLPVAVCGWVVAGAATAVIGTPRGSAASGVALGRLVPGGGTERSAWPPVQKRASSDTLSPQTGQGALSPVVELVELVVIVIVVISR